MAKSKSADPVQAARKAAQARQAKRNREERARVREAVVLRKDTSGMEGEIRSLERKPTRTAQEDADLAALRAEVERIDATKREYVAKHPEQRRLVKGYERTDEERRQDEEEKRRLANANAPSGSRGVGGRDPRWSVYYDPVFNPYGAPPPGMPYADKPYQQLVAEGLVPPPPPGQEGAAATSLPQQQQQQPQQQHQAAGPSTHPPYAAQAQPPMSTRPYRPRPPPPQPGRTGTHSTDPLSFGPPPPGAITSAPPTTVASTPRPRPPGAPPPPPPAVISAAPQLRDLKKEATAFLPAAVRRKRQAEKDRIKRGLPARVDAAPLSSTTTTTTATASADAAPVDESEERGGRVEAKPSLLDALKPHLSRAAAVAAAAPGTSVGATTAQANEAGRQASKKNDYQGFLDSMGDLL